MRQFSVRAFARSAVNKNAWICPPIERNENDNDEPREIRRRVKSTSRGFEDSLQQKSKGWKPLLSQPPRGVEGAHTRRQGARASALRSLAQDQARPKTGTLIKFRRLFPHVPFWGPPPQLPQREPTGEPAGKPSHGRERRTASDSAPAGQRSRSKRQVG